MKLWKLRLMRRGLTLLELIIILVLLGLLAIISGVGASAIGGSIKTGDGVTTGRLTAFRVKGMFCPCGEGIVTHEDSFRPTAGTVIANTWEFTCQTPELYDRLRGLVGKRVRLTYTSYFQAGLWRDTAYLLSDVEELKE